MNLSKCVEVTDPMDLCPGDIVLWVRPEGVISVAREMTDEEQSDFAARLAAS